MENMKQDEGQALVDDRLDAFGLFVHTHVFCASPVNSTHTPILTDSLLALVHIPIYTPFLYHTMSSISFPNEMNHPQSDLDESFYASSFTEHSTGGFQMNPLSSHPPRTPRTSLHHSVTSPNFSSNANTTASHHRHFSTGSVYEEKTEMGDIPGMHIEQTIQVDVEDMEIDPEEEATKSAERKISKEQVWREMLLSSNGRDKAFVRLHAFS